MLIYKILRGPEYERLLAEGITDGAPIDIADGYVHFSTAEQVRETAARHFAGEHGLQLLSVDVTALGEALRWEVSRGGQHFPHLYRQLRVADIHGVNPLPLEDGRHRFDASIA